MSKHMTTKNALIITDSHLESFKVFCEQYQTRFNLMDWDLFYRINDHDTDYYAALSDRNILRRTACVELGKEWTHDCLPTLNNLQKNAKHEMIHLLLTDLARRAEERFVQPEEIHSAEEALVVVLMNLIPNLKRGQ